MASFNEDPADRAAELERMLVGHDCTLETAFGFYTLGDCRYTIGDYKGAHEAWKTLHEANVTNALTDQALFQDGRALDASGDLLGAVHAYNSFAARQPEEALVHFNLVASQMTTSPTPNRTASCWPGQTGALQLPESHMC